MNRLISPLLAAALLSFATLPAHAASKEELDAKVNEAKAELYKFSSAAKELEAKGDLKGALDAYDAVARSAHKNAEDALFATARLRAKLADTDGALESFRSYRQRYPDGAYARVVAVHVLDLLVRKGDDFEILDEANAFLVAYPNDLRAWRFRMARAAIAIKKGDCSSALRDLASVRDAEATPLRRRCKGSTEPDR